MKNNHFLQLFAEAEVPAESTGVTPADAAPEASADPNAEFESLIKGKYKEQYDLRVQDTVRKRLRSSHETVEKFNTLTPALGLLAEHYGVDAGDMAALCRAVEGDDTFYRRQAERRGMDVEQMKAIRALEQENRNLKQDAHRKAAQQHVMAMVTAWKQQAEEARGTYPHLDMNIESKNPQFRRLLLSGLDVASAYLVTHKEELMKHAAEDARKNLVNNILATGIRPGENGTSGQSASVSRYDVASMSRADRESIRKRAARGERIRF